MNFNLNGHIGRVVHNEEARAWIKQHGKENERPTQCFPLYSLLLALNQTRVDFLSLDIEGDELYVLKTIPFDKVDIRMMTVEFAHDKGGDKSMNKFLNSNGYDSLIKVQRWDGKVNDIIARKRGLSSDAGN